MLEPPLDLPCLYQTPGPKLLIVDKSADTRGAVLQKSLSVSRAVPLEWVGIAEVHFVRMECIIHGWS